MVVLAVILIAGGMGCVVMQDQSTPKSSSSMTYWEKYRLWDILRKGGNEYVVKDEAKTKQLLDELSDKLWLVKFKPVNGFNPRNASEFLREIHRYSKARSGRMRVGGASFFRTTSNGKILIGSFLSETPEVLEKDFSKSKTIEFISSEKVTPESFVKYVDSRQESLDQGSKAPSRKQAASLPLNMKKAEEEVKKHYSKAQPEVQEYVLWTARVFGRAKLWLNEDAFADLSAADREKEIKYLEALFKSAQYGRHLTSRLAEAGALKDKRLVPGLMKIAAYSRDGDYDCRPKWIAVAALARQESDEAVPLLVSLVDHGNQNTSMWARAALARKTSQDFGTDKQAWNKWWQSQGHKALEEKYLKPYKYPDKK